MSKGLEAFEIIKKDVGTKIVFNDFMDGKEKIIYEYCFIIEKELKALKIIKECDFEGVLAIHKVATKNGYEERYYCLCKRLSKEEYDLLTEVLK